MKFKVGDKVKLRNACSGVMKGATCKLYFNQNNNCLFASPNGKEFPEAGCSCQSNWIFISDKIDLSHIKKYKVAVFLESLK